MNIKKQIMMAAAMITCLTASAWNSTLYNVNDLEVNVDRGVVELKMHLNPKDFHVKYNQQVEITPVLKSISTPDSVIFPTVIVAGRNAYYNTQREEKYNDILVRSNKQEINYISRTDWQEWMTTSELQLQGRTTGCCNAPKGESPIQPVANLDFRPVRFEPAFHYMTPVAETVKERKIEGKAYVNFPVNKTVIYPDYMVNPVELRKITGSVDSVRLNPDCTVRTITLTGFASPEGPYANNVRLAAGRTEAVKEYVRAQYTFPQSVFKTNSVPEDWQGLRDSVAVSILPDKLAILDFIDNANVPIERRNDELRKRFPTSYEYLLKHIYPSLRHTNYRIDYEIRSYTDVNEIRRVLKERPQNLSLNEFFIAANSYEAGTPEYDNVFETAVLYYPNSVVANLNAANSAMNEGDYKRARMLLNRVMDTSSNSGDDAQKIKEIKDAKTSALYAMAILDALEENYEKARDGFIKAGEAGIKESAEALEQVDNAIKGQENIKYYPSDL